MNFSIGRWTAWIVGAHFLSQLIRLVSNVVLTRLLSPDLFGIMLIMNTFRTGVELLSDVGIPQNLVVSKNGSDPRFYNTAWTIQFLRGLLISLVFASIAWPVSAYYGNNLLFYVMLIGSVSIAIGGLISTSFYNVVRELKISYRNKFDISIELVAAFVQIVPAFISPTIWALVFGNLIAVIVRVVATHYITPRVRNRFYFDRDFALEIFHFSKWIFVSSIFFFLAGNIDRLYLARLISFQELGVYAIASSHAGVVMGLTQKLNDHLAFPIVSRLAAMSRSDIRKQLSSVRFRYLLVVAVALSVLVSFGDFAVGLLYDARYQLTAQMLPVLAAGSWFYTISNLNLAILLGVGRPIYTTFASIAKLVALVGGITIGFRYYGLIGAIVGIAASDFFRCLPLYVGLKRERQGFLSQDVIATSMFVMLCLTLVTLRQYFGLDHPLAQNAWR